MSDLFHTDFGVTHGSSAITIKGTKVTLTIHQRIPHIEGLRHPDNRVVSGRITVRMILTDHITHNSSRLHIGSVVNVVKFAHGKQYPPVNGFETVSNIGQRTTDDNAHSIVQVGLLQLIFDVYRSYIVIEIRHVLDGLNLPPDPP